MPMAGALLVFCALAPGRAMALEPEKKGEAAQKDQEKMQGTWVGFEPGAPLGFPHQFIMTVQGAQYEFKGAGLEFKGTLTLNPAANPKQADFAIKESIASDGDYAGKTALAIYRIDEDGTLTLAANAPGEAARPEKFRRVVDVRVFEFRKWQPGMILPGNPPELKVLEKRIGTWTAENVIKPGPWNPAERKITGVETTEWILGGRFQQTRNTSRPANPDSVYLCTYDPQAKVFRSWFFDDQGGRNEMTGQWDEAAQTMNWTSETNGFRATGATRTIDPDNLAWQLTIRDPNGKVMLEMAGKLVRKK